MFGFLQPTQYSLEYRSLYARCCQHLKRNYGVMSLSFHSYEAVFLYSCLFDAGAFPKELVQSQHCCRLRRASNLTNPKECEIGTCVASIAMTLAEVKLNDDVADDRSLLARIYRRLLKRRFVRARRVLSQYDPDIDQRIQACLNSHAKLESTANSMSIEEYSDPTARAFGHVFGLAGRLVGNQELESQITKLFQLVGRSLIAFDCAIDFPVDTRNGSFNPLKDETQATQTYRKSADWLKEGQLACLDYWGPQSIAANILSSVSEFVQSLAEPVQTGCLSHFDGCKSTLTDTKTQLQQLIRERSKPNYAYMDGGALCAILACLACASMAAGGQQASPCCGRTRKQTLCCGSQPATTCGPCTYTDTQMGSCCGRAFSRGC